MRKLTDQERSVILYIAAAGGSFCPGTAAGIPKAAHRVLGRLVTRGDLTVEETDDGPRLTLTAQGRADAS
jgi:hypothetical protein